MDTIYIVIIVVVVLAFIGFMLYWKNKGNEEAKVILEGGGATLIHFDKIVWNECYFTYKPDSQNSIYKLGVTSDTIHPTSNSLSINDIPKDKLDKYEYCIMYLKNKLLNTKSITGKTAINMCIKEAAKSGEDEHKKIFQIMKGLFNLDRNKDKKNIEDAFNKQLTAVNVVGSLTFNEEGNEYVSQYVRYVDKYLKNTLNEYVSHD